MTKHYLKILSRFNKGGSNVVAGSELLEDQELIYVPTFEKRLYEFILEKEQMGNPIDLIIISGTAGDGKTVLLSKFKDLIGDSINGRGIEYNLDASHADKPNKNQIDDLKVFFREYSDSFLQVKPKKLKLIAINTGMLMHFFKNMKENKQSYRWLEYFTISNLNLPIKQEKPSTKEPVWNIYFIDLSIRDIFIGDDSIFDSLIKNLYEKVVLSKQCSKCPVQKFCFLYSNIKMMNDNQLLRTQIKDLFIRYEIEEASHITLRLFLETLSYLIAGNFSDYKHQTCQKEIEELKKKYDETSDLTLFNQLFYNKIFNLEENSETNITNLRTLVFFNLNKPNFLSSKSWMNYMSYCFASLVSEIRRLKNNFSHLEKFFFSRFQIDIADREEELIGRENQNQQFVKAVMKELTSLKNQTFQYLLQRQYFFQELPYPTEKLMGNDIKSKLLRDFRKLVIFKAEQNIERFERNKSRLISRICTALSLSDNYSETIQKYKTDQNEIILQKKILQLNKIPSVSSIIKLSVDIRNSKIDVPFEEEYRDLFAQLPVRFQVVLKISGNKEIIFEIDFKTYYFIFKIANGYRPSTLDQRKYEAIELIKRKLLYLVSSENYQLNLIAQDMCILKIKTDQNETFFSWRLLC
ncbi:MAG: hypothetical protein ACTSP3_01635 [Candidatus Heimdallarchaeaceae archaeon]